MPSLALVKQVVITSSNCAINVYGTVCNIALGTYYATGSGGAEDLLEAVKDGINTTLFDTLASVALTDGRVVITSDGTTDVRWADAATTFDSTLLGITAINTIYTTTPTTADAAPDGCWYTEEQLGSDTIASWHTSTTQLVTKSGAPYSYNSGGQYATRQIETGFESSSSVLTDYVAWWKDHNDGTGFYLYDYSNDPQSVCLDGTSCADVDKARYSAGVNLYAVKIGLVIK